MSTNNSEKIFNEFAKLQQLDEETDNILKKSKKYIIISIISIVLFGFLFLCFSILQLNVFLSVFFLLWVVISLGICFAYSNKYMFIGFALVAGRLSRFPIIGIIISILYFAIWFLITILLPITNIITVTSYIKKQSSVLKQSIEQIKAHKDFKNLFKN